MLFRNLYHSNREEYWNVITHLIGFVVAFLGMVILLMKSNIGDADFRFVSVLIFGLSSLLMYSMSTLYHLNWDKAYVHHLRTMDHISIYYVIAGTYTPFLLKTFDPEAGWRMLLIIWSLAFIGTLFKLFSTGKYENLSLIFYILMGWTVLLEFEVFVDTTPYNTLVLIALGGLLYLIGVVFYKMKRLKYNHAYWHLFVNSANIAHFLAVYTII